MSKAEWEWNCGTGNHPGTELASLGAGSSVPAGLCPGWECLFPGSWDRGIQYLPWEGEIGCLEHWSSSWEQSQTPRLSLPCRTRLVCGWGVAPLIKDTAAVARGARDGVGRRESPGLCSHSLCARARESSIQPGSCCCA